RVAATLRIRAIAAQIERLTISLLSSAASSVSEPDVESRLQDVGRVVVAVEITLIAEPRAHPLEYRRVRRELGEVHVEREAEQVRREIAHPVVARQISVDAVHRGVFVAVEARRRLRVVAVLPLREEPLGDVLAELAAHLVRVDAPVVVVEAVAELETGALLEVVVELDEGVAALAMVGMPLRHDP